MLIRTLLPVFIGACAAWMATAAEVPRPATDFAINMEDGSQIPLSQYRGKVCVLAFILTTCPHCQKTVGILSTIQNEYGPRGVQVIASATDDMGKLNVPDFIKNFHPSFPVGFNARLDAEGFLQHDDKFLLYVPQLVFIDRQGVIRAQHPGEDKDFWENQEKNIRDQIDALLAEPAHKKHTAAK